MSDIIRADIKIYQYTILFSQPFRQISHPLITQVVICKIQIPDFHMSLAHPNL
jgi:hypothetical protein